ncbi:PorT family protein [Hymenobacter aerilatus]|uniref:PorT family protein n=1 Tax=Hymenobacter aerilatus TaxID=2932251 RepID=A0A8T9SXL8_9BACT|nr:porin family protein [Hymenobacter aerilatus]UOR04546.1 PorT family protein [Hymenobacter aerilatus]
MKQLLFLAAGVLLASAAQAQFGVKAGAHYATLATKENGRTRTYYEGQTNAKGRIGYQVGVFYEKKLVGRLSLVPELQYSRQASDLTVSNGLIPDNAYYADYRLTLHYLNVPVVARVMLGRFYLETGPQGGLLFAAHEKGYERRVSVFNIGHHQGPSNFDQAATDHYQRFDVGACAGAGVKLPGGFAIGLRYSAGFISISRKLEPDTYGGSLKNQVAQASVSYQLGG